MSGTLKPRRPLRLLRSRIFWRSVVIMAHDATLAFLSLGTAYWLRFEGTGQDIPNVPSKFLYAGLFALIVLAVEWTLRIDRDLWRYTSLGALGRLWRSIALSVLVFLLAAFLLTRTDEIPRTVPLIAAFLLVGSATLSRILWRLRVEGLASAMPAVERIPVVLIGAGMQADNFIRALRRNREAPYQVEALLSRDRELRDRRIQDVRVWGAPEELATTVEALRARGRRVQKVIFTDDEPFSGIGAELVEACERLGLSVARLPHFAELRGRLDVATELRPVAIEDLLGRSQVRINEKQIEGLIEGRTVMVTGAGGSIGSELVRQVASQRPGRLVLLDQSEFNLYTIDRLMADAMPGVPRVAGLCDVRDRQRVMRWFADEKPDIVFHAAALKHVPLVEGNASDGVFTNIVGTRNVADVARASGCAVMVLISTDKAINPANVMGATKRAAEAYCQALDIAANADGPGTRYVTVRFGNVLGSAGSVVPLFQEQLARGGPLTVTHPEIARYFMTIPEAVQLVLQASAAAVAERSGIGQIFLLDMGKPIRIADLARQMIRLSGKRPDVDVKIEFIGLRPGEKLMEELAYLDEGLAPSGVPGVMLARPHARELGALQRGIDLLAAAACSYENERCKALLRDLLPEYRPADDCSAAAKPEAAGTGEAGTGEAGTGTSGPPAAIPLRATTRNLKVVR